jgi:hypothetical protein
VNERPHGHSAAEQRDELARPHSITSSASASNLSGISRPSALAVLKLTTSSNFCRQHKRRSHTYPIGSRFIGYFQWVTAHQRVVIDLFEKRLRLPRILDPYPDQRFAVTHPRWEPCAGIPPARIWAGGSP